MEWQARWLEHSKMQALHPSTKTSLRMFNKVTLNKCGVTPLSYHRRSSHHGSPSKLSDSFTSCFDFSCVVLCSHQLFGADKTAPAQGKPHIREAAVVLSLTLMGARPTLGQLRSLFSTVRTALCERSVNNSIKYSLWKGSKSPSTEQTSVMKWAFLGSENPCLTLSNVIAWLSKKYQQIYPPAAGKSDRAG